MLVIGARGSQLALWQANYTKDRLEARGFIKRMPSREDRRSVLVRLSAKGGEFFRKFYPELIRNNRALFEKAFRPDQLKELSKLLNLLIRSLEAE